MRYWVILAASVLALGVAAAAPQPATAQPAPVVSAAHYATASTSIGDILDNPATKAIAVKYLPGVLDNDQIDAARPLTLKDLQGYAPDKITDAALASIDAEFAKLPVKK